ncbi:ACP S-malonyltransferase [Limibacillus sp. MBR-115]|uniref:ACP S-malonyltransferase n=1 Tax=Limibacillus sp. MBR-115 TaxID=3156465 RepID=UPI003397E617
MARAFVFPGQGSQAIGMGQAMYETFPAARLVFEEVDDALSQNLTKLMFEGPENDLTLTENAQPAIMVCSLAVVRVLESEGNFALSERAQFVAGHSLGEYSALAAAGAFTLADTARLLKKRGQAMQQAVALGEGAMAAILGLSFEEVVAVAAEAAEGEVCQAANDNAPGQVVISGHTAAVERAIVLAKERGAKRALALPVSAPFHCRLMEPAAEAMAEALEAVAIQPPSLPVIANVTAAPVFEPQTIRRLLVEQVTGMVRWRESVEAMKVLEIERCVELGNGKVLSGLIKRIDREIQADAAGTPDEIDGLLKSL